MEKKLLACLFALSVGGGLASVAHADGNTILFTGTVSDTTCTATIDSGVSSVEMGTVSVADLNTYSYSAAKSFSFNLANCPSTEDGGTTTAKVTFGGDSDTSNSDYFLNQASTGAATGVAVGVFDSAGNALKNNVEGAAIDISSGAATIPFTAKMVKTGATVTKGAVQTTVTYNVTYY